MAFDLSIPDPEVTKAEVEQELAVPEESVAIISSAAAERGAQIMAANLDDVAERRDILEAIESLGVEVMKQSSAKNEILSRRMVQFSRQGGESGEVAKSLEELAIKMRDLDPSGVDFAKKGRFFSPVRRYFERYKTADAEISSIVESLERGKSTLQSDNVTLQLEEDSMRELTGQLNKQIELALDLDAYLAAAVERAKQDPATDPERIKFVEEEVLFPLRQKILDLQQLLVVNQQGIVSMNILRRNNLELIRAVDRAENVTVSALRVAATVAGALYNQRIVLEKVNTLNAATNQMIASTAQMLHEQGAAIQTQATEANISVDTLKASFAETLQALEDISTYREAALPRIRQTIDDFQELADEGQRYIDRLERREQMMGELPAAQQPAAELPAGQ